MYVCHVDFMGALGDCTADDGFFNCDIRKSEGIGPVKWKVCSDPLWFDSCALVSPSSCAGAEACPQGYECSASSSSCGDATWGGHSCINSTGTNTTDCLPGNGCERVWFPSHAHTHTPTNPPTHTHPHTYTHTHTHAHTHLWIAALFFRYVYLSDIAYVHA